MFPEEKSIEKVIRSIRDTNDCKSNKERVALNHDLKNQLVDELINVRIEKGVIKIKTFKIIYLNDYMNNKLIKLIVIKLFKMPSRENTFKLVVLSLVIILSSFKIN